MFKHQYVYNQDLVYKAEQKTFKKIDSFKVMQRAAKVCYAFIVKNLTAKKENSLIYNIPNRIDMKKWQEILGYQ